MLTFSHRLQTELIMSCLSHFQENVKKLGKFSGHFLVKVHRSAYRNQQFNKNVFIEYCIIRTVVSVSVNGVSGDQAV